MENGIELSQLISQLRTELLIAMDEGEGNKLRFVPESVDLELQVCVTKSDEGGAKVKFWVVDAGGKETSTKAVTQVVKLRLAPKLAQPDGTIRETLIKG